MFPPSSGSSLTITIQWLTNVGKVRVITVLLNRWPHVVFDNPVILYPPIHNHRDSVTSTPFHSLEYVYIVLYILFLHFFHIFTSYIFPCWQLTIKPYCFQRFGLSLAFLLSPTYFSHLALLPWRWRQQNSQECLSSMISYLSKRIRHRESHSEMEIDISKKFKSQEHVCLQTSVKFQFSQLNKASAMCSNNPTSKAESVMQVSSFRKLYTSSRANYWHCKPNRTRKCALNMR